MEFFNRIITHYGWEGTALAGVLLVMFGIQLYYYLFVYGRIQIGRASCRERV